LFEGKREKLKRRRKEIDAQKDRGVYRKQGKGPGEPYGPRPEKKRVQKTV